MKAKVELQEAKDWVKNWKSDTDLQQELQENETPNKAEIYINDFDLFRGTVECLMLIITTDLRKITFYPNGEYVKSDYE